ncbi:MAG: NAD-dependent epimerase/dehydratase family protein [Jiangellaceae bacterium]
MRIFLAGATGAVGTRLVPVLVGAGHAVVGTTRSAAKFDALEQAGAEPVAMDGLDRDAVMTAVTSAKPDVVIHQLTALTGMGNPKKFDDEFAVTNRLRTEGTDHLLSAAREAGAQRFVAQSYTGWPNERSGGPVKTEDDPLDRHPTAPSRRSLAAIEYLESTVAGASDIEGIVLRYGSFYGPGTGLSVGGELVEMVRKRRFPIVGGGTGVFSFVHIDDAATATLAAVEHGTPGIYNVVDDDPAPLAEWLPYLAEVIGAKPPMRLPAWLVRPMLGEHGMAIMTTMRGSSNAKAKQELGWKLAYPSWRDGFRTGLS